MTLAAVALLVLLVCALVEQFQAQGRSVGWWGVIVFAAIGLIGAL